MAEPLDELLLPLKEGLEDWTDYDVASYFLGKALGVVDPVTTFSEFKGQFYSGGDTDGVKLLGSLKFLVQQGLLESRDFEFRWPQRRRSA